MFTTTELSALQEITSKARLSSYKRVLGTTTLAESYGAYMWNKAIASAFSPLIQALEVCLRNAMNNTIAPVYGQDWFEQWANRAAVELRKSGKLTGQSEGEKQVAKARAKIIQKSRNSSFSWQAVLAELTFGFWVEFLTSKYWDVNQRTKLWPNHLSAVFPTAPRSMHAQGALHKEYKAVVDLRNRIHHQEPLWKHACVTNADDAIIYLRQQLQACIARLSYLSPDKLSALQRYGVIAAIEERCCKESFLRFTGQSKGKHTGLRQAKKDLRLLAKSTPDQQSVWIVSESNQPRLVLRPASRRFF